MSGILLGTLTSDGPTDEITRIDGKTTVACYGTWDTANVAVQISMDDGTTWVEDTEVVFHKNAHANIERYGSILRFNMSGAGTDSVKCYVSE